MNGREIEESDAKKRWKSERERDEIEINMKGIEKWKGDRWSRNEREKERWKWAECEKSYWKIFVLKGEKEIYCNQERKEKEKEKNETETKMGRGVNSKVRETFFVWIKN